MIEEKRIYVAVAATVQAIRNVVQPSGRQIAQACHVVSKLRHGAIKFEYDHRDHEFDLAPFNPITTIILQVRDSAELDHVYDLLVKKKLNPVEFEDNNPEYGPGDFPTAVAALATPKQVKGILDYLPLWSGK